MSAEREAVAEGTRRLARWAAAIQLEDIPEAVLARAVSVLADDLGAMIGARDEPEVVRFHALLAERSKSREATLFRGADLRVDRISAAVGNAVAADWLELDEGYRIAACHAGLYVLPVLLAEAESRNMRLGEMLRALMLGYEIVTRVARSWTSPVLTMQAHGRYCAIGAAASASLAQGQNAALLLNSLTNAATLLGPSPRNHLAEGALVRNVWPATGAWSGMMAVDWAACGINGLDGAFYDVYSMVFGGKAHPERLADNLGGSWAILDGYSKVYACCQLLHSAVEACLALRNDVLSQASLDTVTKIEVEASSLALPLANANPETTLGAKFSMPHAVAAVLVIGSGGASAFSADTLDDKAIAGLRQRVSMRLYEPTLAPPNDRPARVTVHFSNGQMVSAECLSAIGGPDRPLAPTVVFDKLNELASPVYPAIVPVFKDLLDVAPQRLQQRWPALLQEISSGR